MTARATPGPWSTYPASAGAWSVFAPDPSTYAEEGEEVLIAADLTAANARLIAKAWLLPELVEALRAAATTIELHAPMLDTANRAREVLARYDEPAR
jgi:hypothetical protein